MQPEVNFTSVIVAAVAAMVVGAVWYAPRVFGREWVKLVKLDAKKAQKTALKAMAIMFLFSLIAAYVLAVIAYLTFQYFDVSFLQAAFSGAFFTWLGFVAYASIPNAIFELRPTKLILINAGGQFAALIVMGLTIGWIGI